MHQSSRRSLLTLFWLSEVNLLYSGHMDILPVSICQLEQVKLLVCAVNTHVQQQHLM